MLISPIIWILITTIPFFPTTAENIVKFLLYSITISLFIFTICPDKKMVYIPRKDGYLILFNIFMSAIIITIFLYIIDQNTESVYNVSYTGDINIINLSNCINFYKIPLYELLYLPLWSIMDEILFFSVHKLMHTSSLYYIHKIHHKYKITNVWCSFYAHPLDHMFVILASIIGPFIMLLMGFRCSVTILTIFLYGAIITFIQSHHVSTSPNKSIIITRHHIHHKKNIFNYGNFHLFDIINGSNL